MQSLPMRLLHSLKYQLDEFVEPDIPPYAILSHMWGEEEVSLQDILNLPNPAIHAREGFEKIKNCCDQAKLEGIQWVWIDTCCLDRSNNKELSEAINSMYKWYEKAIVCYAYLSDVSSSVDEIRPTLQRCRWFLRKWTLQELVAPCSVVFFARDWVRIGTRTSLHSIISEITEIQSAVLIGEKKPKQCHVSERMAWASNRTTTRVEDEAYSLMGLFDITMPILYGEGSRAFRRLQGEISKTHYASLLDTARAGMHLLVTKSNPLEIKSFAASDSPEYAILSHTWGLADDEVSFSDVRRGIAESKKAYGKIRKSCELAASHGFEYIWIDTCCINKSSSAELQEAICSMYRWYKSARICYVYLEDFLMSPGKPNLWQSRWFTRGWTLQELIAPTFVEFYDENWIEIGTKLSLCEHISDVTGIDPTILRGSDPMERTVAERMSWAALRSTTRTEDAAYCLMGLFDVFMPMLYGEGSRAFTRLQEEIMKKSEDYTIFAWKASFMSGNHRGLLAHSPAEFLAGTSVTSGNYEVEQQPSHPPTMTSRGLFIELPLLKVDSIPDNDRYMAWVGSSKPAQNGILTQEDAIACIWLQSIPSRPPTYVRVFPERLHFLPKSDGHKFSMERLYVLPYGTMSDDKTYEIDRTRSGMVLVHHPQDSEVQLLNILPSMLSHHYSDVKWKPGSKELLYSYDNETCIVAALFLENTEDRLIILIGFRNHLPWCAVVSLTELGYTSGRGLERLGEAIQEICDNLKWLSNQTDRSSKTLSNGSVVAAAFRIGCPTKLNPTVFNLKIHQGKELLSPIVAPLSQEHRVIFAPNSYEKTGPTVFLSGFIDGSPTTWQTSLSKSLSHLPITILNPHRPDWDSSWREELSFPPFSQQVSWELDEMKKADVIAICFGVNTQAPITLMEFGLFASSGKCVVACPEGYWKRGNVHAVCERHGIKVLNDAAELKEAVVAKLIELGKLP